MASSKTRTIRKWATFIVVLTFIISLSVWLLRQDTLPRTLRIATGEEGGLYYRLGEDIDAAISERTHRRVVVESTNGSVDNRRMLLSGAVDLAVVQGGSVRMDDLTVVTPLFPELVLVIVRKGNGIKGIADLGGRNVSLGPEGSGNRESALRLLKHFGVDPAGLGERDLYFYDLLTETSLDAAIVTAGIGNPDLGRVLRTNAFELLPIEVAEAVEILHPFLTFAEVPRGLFAMSPAVPPQRLPTIATTAYLVARDDASDSLVNAALASVHEESLKLKIPMLISRREALDRVPTRLHPVAQRYFSPSDSIGYMANVMESLAATKELLFAIGAGIYLLWVRWRRLKAKEAQEAIDIQKERLDSMLEKTLRIETIHMRSTNTKKLGSLLEELTILKLEALRDFTEEELRGDQAFQVFLMQCGALMNTIQLKILSLNTESQSEV